MELKLKMVDAMNTFNVALVILKNKNYNLGIEADSEDEEDAQWYAEKEGRIFYAWDPLRLLGLIALWENRGDNWNSKINEEDLYGKITSEN